MVWSYSAGRTTGSFVNFSYGSGPSSYDSTKWIRTSLITKYSPHGEVVEETDALHIATSARFAHSNSVPSIIAKNAEFGTACFESFEDRTIASGIINTDAHTGKISQQITTTQINVCSLLVTPRTQTYGYILRAWVKGGPTQVASVFGRY